MNLDDHQMVLLRRRKNKALCKILKIRIKNFVNYF